MFSDYPEEIQHRGNDNLRSSKTQNKLEKGLPLAKASRIFYTSMDSLSLNKRELTEF